MDEAAPQTHWSMVGVALAGTLADDGERRPYGWMNKLPAK
jgi:hypothetical protein